MSIYYGTIYGTLTYTFSAINVFKKVSALSKTKEAQLWARPAYVSPEVGFAGFGLAGSTFNRFSFGR